MKLGTVKRLGFDAEGYERRERVGAIAECPDCGNEVALVQETEEWTQRKDGRWRHSSYGPAMGTCCGNLIVDSFEGCEVYRLPKQEAK